MSSNKEFTATVNVDDFTAEVGRIEDLSDRVRVAGYGLAAPLVTARAGQLQREVARTAKRKGAKHAEVALRQANLERGEARFALFAEELDRARLSRPEIDAEKGAAVWGRVADEGAPVAGLTVSALADGERLGFSCTDELGAFSIEVPPKTAFRLSVRGADGAELYRDPDASDLAAGELRYREIDLTRGAEKPCPDPGPEPGDPRDDSFAMLDLVGRTEAAALSLLRNQGLKVTSRTEEPVDGRAGLIVSHVPEAGAQVRRGDGVAIVVGASDRVTVPDLIGLGLPAAEKRLKQADLSPGAISEKVVRGERAGLIIEQSPMPGNLLDRGAPVALVIGVPDDTQSDLVTVPDVTGVSQDEAAMILKQAELKVGAVRDVPAETGTVGLVVGQVPAAGTLARRGDAVALTVGAGRLRDGPGVPRPEASVGEIAEIAEARLRESGAIAARTEPGSVARRLEKAGVATLDEFDAMIAQSRRELRDRLGFRTLAETDKTIRALKFARNKVRG